MSPPKALIKDQRRLDGLCERLEIPLLQRHGDVSGSSKRRTRAKPDRIVLITPESLEVLFVCRAPVVDELLAFIGTERGVQLQPLLKRLERAISCRVPRVGFLTTR